MLLDYTNDVRMLTNGNSFDADGELAGHVEGEGIEVRTDRLDRLEGGDVLESVLTRDGERIPVDGLFVVLGTAGGTDLAEMLGVPVEGDSIVTESINRRLSVESTLRAT